MSKGCAGFTIVEAVIAIAVLVILVSVILISTSNMFKATTVADNLMLVNAQNQRAASVLREDLIQTSRNFTSPYHYAPVHDTDTNELRFRKINGFDFNQGYNTYETFYTCYYLDTTQNILYKRFRDLDGNLLADPAPKPVGAFVTVFTFAIDQDVGTVSFTITTDRGKTERGEDMSYTRSVIVSPFNFD